MDIKKNLIRPIIIGVAGASKSGKAILRRKIADLLKDFDICQVFLEYYRKEIDSECEDKNRDSPFAFDFDLLLKDLELLRNGNSVTVKERDNKEIILKPDPVIFIDGVLTFYDHRIRNLFDLKIFIDVDLDICLINKISKELSSNNCENLNEIIEKYHKYLRPIYVKYLTPYKRYADVILPQIEEESAFIPILAEYLKMQLNKIMNGDLHYLFTSQNEIVDPKYQYFDKNILASSESSHINFFKQVFEDVITNEEDEFIIDKIQEKLIGILNENLYKFFREKTFFKGNFPKVDLVISEFDDLNEYDWTEYKKIMFFKAFVMNEKDMEIPKLIFRENKKASIIVNSIFLSPKLAEIELSNKLDTLLLNTLYFSDFLTKFELVIKENKKSFDPEKLAQKFKNSAMIFEE